MDPITLKALLIPAPLFITIGAAYVSAFLRGRL